MYLHPIIIILLLFLLPNIVIILLLFFYLLLLLLLPYIIIIIIIITVYYYYYYYFCYHKFTRRGQHVDGAACGAAVAALTHCLSCKPVPDRDHLGDKPFDYQMSYIISEVSKRLPKILTNEDENERQAELTKQMFEISKTFLEEIATLDFGTVHSNLILLGGIQINMPGLLNGKKNNYRCYDYYCYCCYYYYY
jgi:Ca2+/Na+ antiporter